MSAEVARSHGNSIRENAEVPIQAYEGYLACLHYCDYPEEIPAELSESLGVPDAYKDLGEQTAVEFSHTLRDRLSFVLSTTLTATDKPTTLFRAERHAETIPGIQLYLTQIVGHVAMQRVVAEGWAEINPHLSQLRNPFENYDTLQAVWKYMNDKRQTAGLEDLNALAPGYYDASE